LEVRRLRPIVAAVHGNNPKVEFTLTHARREGKGEEEEKRRRTEKYPTTSAVKPFLTSYFAGRVYGNPWVTLSSLTE